MPGTKAKIDRASQRENLGRIEAVNINVERKKRVKAKEYRDAS